MESLENIKGIQLSVKFHKGTVYANFESSQKKAVDWDDISDDQYEYMMDEAIRSIHNMKKEYKNQFE